MTTDPFVLIDRTRQRLFNRVATAHRPLRGARIATDSSGVAWSWVQSGESCLGLTWLGPGRVWDAAWARDNADEVARARRAMAGATSKRHQAELDRAIAGLRLGGHAGRVLLAVHRAVLAQKTSLVTVADSWLARMVWGPAGTDRPRHWRSVLLEVLRSLTWLHVAEPPSDGEMPAFGPATVLLTHAGDLRGTGDDECPDCCPCRGSRHHHFQIDVGPGFLGALEQFGRDEEGSGVRAYRFVPRHRRGAPGPSLSAAGKSGSLVSAFIPALLGDPDACRRLSGAGHRLLQALVRETTRSRARSDDADGRAEVLEGNRLRSYSGRSSVACRLLDADGTYIGFNGNGKRRGMGYRLAGEWGWPARADYPHDALGDFLDDLAAAVEVLSLTVFGVGPGNECYSLLRLRALADSAAGRRELARIDVRAFAPADFAERWSAKFGWPLSHGEEQKRPELTVGVEMRSRGLSGRKLAKALGCDPSFFGKLLKGKKPWPPALLKKALGHLRGAKRNGARSSGMNSGRTSPS